MSQDSTGQPGARYTSQTVLDKVVWVPGQLFSLRVTRDPDYRFTPGQFARIGLPIAGGAAIGLINLIGNGVATMAVARWDNQVDMDVLRSELKKGPRSPEAAREHDAPVPNVVT